MMVLVPANGVLAPRTWVRDGVDPPKRGVCRCHPGEFPKICFQNPAFLCHEHQ